MENGINVENKAAHVSEIGMARDLKKEKEASKENVKKKHKKKTNPTLEGDEKGIATIACTLNTQKRVPRK